MARYRTSRRSAKQDSIAEHRLFYHADRSRHPLLVGPVHLAGDHDQVEGALSGVRVGGHAIHILVQHGDPPAKLYLVR